MKRIILAILLLLAWLLTSCADTSAPEKQQAAAVTPPTIEEPAPTPEPEPEPVTPAPVGEPEPEPVQQTEQEPEPSDIILTISTPDGLYTYNGSDTTLIAGESIHVTGRQYISGSTLTDYATDATSDIGHEPTRAAYDGVDLWTCVEIPPDEALAAGGQYKYYTEFMQNSVSLGHWVFNQHRCIDLAASSGVIVVETETGALIDIHGLINGIHVAQPGLLISDYDGIARTAEINSAPVSWSTNYMSGAVWQQIDGLWVGHNGYIWDGSTLIETVSDWHDYPYPSSSPNGEAPVVVNAGNGYWIDCNTGELIRDGAIVATLYTGDMTRESGLVIAETISPTIIENELYFFHDGAVRRYNLDTGFSDVFYNGYGIITPWGE